MIKCPYCGSGRLQNKGGENGNPFDRRPGKTTCLDCGRTLPFGESEVLRKPSVTIPPVPETSTRKRKRLK